MPAAIRPDFATSPGRGYTFAMKIGGTSQETDRRPGYLDGQVLVAMPTIRDERFARSVIYICAQSDEGAMGIVVNQPAQNIKVRDLLIQLEVVPSENLIQIPPRAENKGPSAGTPGAPMNIKTHHSVAKGIQIRFIVPDLKGNGALILTRTGDLYHVKVAL